MGINVKQLIEEGQMIVKVSPEYITEGYLTILCEANSQCL
jgi:hypothetical protein